MISILIRAGALLTLGLSAAYAGNDMKDTKSMAREPSPDTGFYVAVYGGANIAQSIGDGFTQGRSPVTPDAFTSIHDGDSIGGVGGVKFGYKFDPYFITEGIALQPTVEAEAFYLGTRLTLQANINQPTLPANFDARAKADLNEGAFFVNGIVRVKNHSIFTPYLGAGIGGLYMDTSSVNFTIRGSRPGIGAFQLPILNHDQSDNDFVFAMQVIGGCDVEIAPHWSLFAEYKFLTAVDPEFNYTSVTTAGDDYRINPDFFYQHLLIAGVKYNF